MFRFVTTLQVLAQQAIISPYFLWQEKIEGVETQIQS